MSKKTYKIRAFWEISADIEIEADSLEDAITDIANSNLPTKNINYEPVYTRIVEIKDCT